MRKDENDEKIKKRTEKAEKDKMKEKKRRTEIRINVYKNQITSNILCFTSIP